MRVEQGREPSSVMHQGYALSFNSFQQFKKTVSIDNTKSKFYFIIQKSKEVIQKSKEIIQKRKKMQQSNIFDKCPHVSIEEYKMVQNRNI